MMRLRFLPDPFTLVLAAVVVAATVLPCRGAWAIGFDRVTNLAIGLLFFMHGAKLSREAVLAGLTHWRLHLAIFLCTFAMFPLLALLLRPVLLPLVTPELYVGILFLSALPATVQSAIAFTSMARGNVSAAVCSASGSSLIGIVLTPLLVGLLLSQHGSAAASFEAIRSIVLQLLLPFVAGQVARRWIGPWIERHRAALSTVDRSSILLVVYTAFSEATIQGLWHQVPLQALAGLLLACAVILGLALGFTTLLARRLGFDTPDEITMVFCGSKKSLASGIPMARVLFASQAVGAVVLPLMLFHQLQLMVCAVLAQRYAARPRGAEAG
ncbi:MAG: bile acid:sodium symporter [Pseudomonadota bacterium]|nr:bile acid:sodium symporter [Pseudomonadota bacterium]